MVSVVRAGSMCDILVDDRQNSFLLTSKGSSGNSFIFFLNHINCLVTKQHADSQSKNICSMMVVELPTASSG